MRRSSVTREWTTVRLRATCAFGCHLHGGETALYIRRGREWFFVCQTHAKEQYGEAPPARGIFSGDDAKSRSVGE